MSHSRRSGIEDYLTGRPSAPAPAAFEGTTLSAFAAARAVSERRSEVPPGLLKDLRTATVRHMAVAAAVRSLLAAWSEHGIDALLFKGFHLAQFVYDSPGERPYSDVDIVLRGEEEAVEASRIAQELGWREIWCAFQPDDMFGFRGPRYCGHEVLHLKRDDLDLRLDVHRRLVHNNDDRIPEWTRQERMTRAAWSSARRRDWNGVKVWELCPVDAVLLGLVLSRCWSGDEWRLRPHDYLDFRQLVRRHGFDRRDLENRARQLGCPRTLEIFLERCNPFEGKCDLRPPGFLRLQLWDRRVASERGNRNWQKLGLSSLRRLRQMGDVARAVLLRFR